MTSRTNVCLQIAALAAAALLSACGGGGGGGDSGGVGTAAVTPGGTTGASGTTGNTSAPPTLEAGAPAATGNIATDGFNWLNYRRNQAGVSTLSRNSLIDKAAQGHSDYQNLNNTNTHTQTAGKPGFTGASELDRLTAAGYQFNSRQSYAYGEVIASATTTSGAVLAENLISAIYHRFVILEPVFKEGGAASSTGSGGYTYLTADFTANNGYSSGLGGGRVVTYPVANQTRIPTAFSSDHETPDPVPNQDVVGYPVSVQGDITATLAVKSFTVRPCGGSDLAVRLLQHASDAETPVSGAAIIPLAVLSANTVYDVSFSGTADGVDVSRSWSFTTQ